MKRYGRGEEEDAGVTYMTSATEVHDVSGHHHSTYEFRIDDDGTQREPYARQRA